MRSSFISKTSVRGFALACTVALLALANSVFAADHKDAPLISEDKALDLLDVFAFVSPADTSKVVLAATVNGFTVPGELNVGFASNALYEFKIDNNGDFKEDLVIQATFSKIGSTQQFIVSRPAKPKVLGAGSELLGAKNIAVTGAANGTTVSSSDGTIRVFAGLRDDPFYTDLIWVVRQIGAVAGGPLARAKGIDFLAGLNCSILAVEVPKSLLTRTNGSSTINVWGTTSRPAEVISSARRDPKRGSKAFVQIERTAVPVLNTVIHSALTNKILVKDAFNRGTPATDMKRFRQNAVDAVVAIGILNSTAAAALVDAVLMPDVLRLNVNNATDGFPNGRRPQDDVVNVVLNAASNGAITNDGVEANDTTFPTSFPFFGSPHTALEGVPSRDATS